MSVETWDPSALSDDEKLTLTDAAIKHVAHALSKRGHGVGMQLSLKKSGCSGLMYIVDYVDTPNAEDYCFPFTDNLSLYVSKKDFPFLKGTQIDYVQEGLNGMFKYDNPNEKGSCGCGESFSV